MLFRIAKTDFEIREYSRSAFELVEAFDSSKDNLFIYGDVGTGKTHLAARLIYRELLKPGASCGWITLSTWLRSLRGQEGSEEQRLIDDRVAKRVLVVDDFGVEKMTEFALQATLDLIEGRLLCERNGLVITSNLSLDHLASKFNDDRLPSRLAGMCKLAEIRGEDWRQK